MKDYAGLDITREIINTYEAGTPWNESSVRKRTKELTKEFFEIWKMP